MKKNFILVFMVLIGMAGNIAALEKRTALIIGNSAYDKSSLKNPVNDAIDMGEKLSELGFDVTLLQDVTLSQMESTVKEFSNNLENVKGVGLFYYAGHAVQVEGYNYLIPVGTNISAENEIQYKAYNMGLILEKMEMAGNETNIIILDACRDNPFASSFRSGGSRGLSEVKSPEGSLIVYATGPGDTASDGEGRNGIFTGALLKHMEETVDVEVLMRTVRAEVKDLTGGKQTPWTSSSLVNEFYFATSELLQDRVRKELTRVEGELSGLDTEILRLNEAMSAAISQSEQQKLQVEKQRQLALQASKKLVQENLLAEGIRQKEDAARLETERLALEKSRTEEEARQEQLIQEAALKREQLQELQLGGRDPAILISNIETLESAIKDIEKSYAASWRSAQREIMKTYRLKRTELDQSEMDPWESQDEFDQRIQKLKDDLTRMEESEIRSRESAYNREKFQQLVDLKKQLSDAIASLESNIWMLKGNSIKLTAYEFNRESKEWAFLIESLDQSVPFRTILSKKMDDSSDIREVYRALDTAIKTNALTVEIQWDMDHRIEEKKNYYTTSYETVYDQRVESVKIIDILNDIEIVTDTTRHIISTLNRSSEVLNPPHIYSQLSFYTSSSGENDVYCNGGFLGQTPLEIDLLMEGDFEFTFYSEKLNISTTRTLTLESGRNRIDSAVFSDRYALVRGGSFDMGSNSNESNEKPEHRVTLTTFIMGKYEITQKEYKDLVGNNPSKENRGIGNNYPVNNVNWNSAVRFCNKLSIQEGLTPCYTGYGDSTKCDFSANGYRLPTEAEWEFAAMGGLSSRYYNYSGSSSLDSVSWHKNNASGKSHPVGGKSSNELGLFDLSGNLQEWCWDWSGEYSYGSQNDPNGPISGSRRILRGGSWYQSNTNTCKVSYRDSREPSYRGSYYGFRVVRRP